jgi:hypothetical protein
MEHLDEEIVAPLSREDIGTEAPSTFLDFLRAQPGRTRSQEIEGRFGRGQAGIAKPLLVLGVSLVPRVSESRR